MVLKHTIFNICIWEALHMTCKPVTPLHSKFHFLITNYKKHLFTPLVKSWIWITWGEGEIKCLHVAHFMMHFLLPAYSHIFIAWFFCVPNYTVDKFLKRKRIWKEQTSQRQGQQLSWKCLLFLQHKLKHNYASDVAAIPFHYPCASIEGFCSYWMEVPKSI